MSKRITLLGSTGSIGTQSLDVIRAQGYEVFGLSAHSHVDKILQQIEEFHPRYVCMTDPDAARRLDAELSGRADAPRLLVGPEGLKQLAALDGTDVVLNSVVGIAGLGASLCAIESGHDLALANKESLVTGGHLVTQAVAKHGVKLLPVDSEHSAIFQCLQDVAERYLRGIHGVECIVERRSGELEAAYVARGLEPDVGRFEQDRRPDTAVVVDQVGDRRFGDVSADAE